MSYLNYISEVKNSRVVILYPGRFSPYHAGHQFSYQKLRESFPENEVYLVTSDVERDAKHPFSFDDKVQIVTTMFTDIDEDHIVENHFPYDVKATLETLELDPKHTIVIVAIGEKDFDERLKDDPYFIDFDGMLDYTAKHHAYKYEVPQLDLNIGSEVISGSVIRKVFSGDDELTKKKIFKTIYPEWNSKIFKLLKERINEKWNVNT